MWLQSINKIAPRIFHTIKVVISDPEKFVTQSIEIMATFGFVHRHSQEAFELKNASFGKITFKNRSDAAQT